jgi:hypothetical protein
MPYIDVRDPTGKLLFKYDAQRGLIEIKARNVGTVVVDLGRYQLQAGDLVDEQLCADRPQ